MRTSLKVTFAALSLIAAGALVACSSGSKDSSDKAISVVIATDGATKPFTYSDSQGNLTGYDIEVARAVFKKLPQYKVKFQVTDFSGISPGIDSGRYQMGANDFGWEKSRAEKYYFSSPLSKSNNAVLVKSGTYKTLADLAGKSTIGNPASNYTKSIQDWNKANPDKEIKISYSADSTSINTRFTQVESGKIDFMLYDKISLESAVQEQGFDNLKIEDISMDTGDAEHDGYEYFLFGKDSQGKKLQKDVNGVLAKMQADGSLAKISKKYLGGDFVPKAEMFK
ncbi:L-Cystine ABC transporter periplasmic cystine-binding protein TcyA [Lactococcus lactis subsp. lactis]|uniref:amino acid ABC transporter substrate-binding protein n=1 Tax=Lactococcus lactis TaxID=1358 RepID=UPI00071C4FE3|nr:amino acid ABC transporter substrate-binding protein [Lactococcus lactis]ARE10746.1 amino acid ABC transporter substrate-binding protein [Lactococcus lactis subsp. lactis]KSU31666.1 L-Cystine ABC transporter periplasmic cystine-binding protein TcyA [Lactococcus lactis subsp. lactis]UPG98821.1 amino acid ABC transporter substrate-binding protein [Lactococcus lactis]URL09754.1 amino acid ABC transporter substrate-binding protein [Lactococcus lactis subsp. lactis]GEB08218.1 amino acid ABC tran